MLSARYVCLLIGCKSPLRIAEFGAAIQYLAVISALRQLASFHGGEETLLRGHEIVLRWVDGVRERFGWLFELMANIGCKVAQS